MLRSAHVWLGALLAAGCAALAEDIAAELEPSGEPSFEAPPTIPDELADADSGGEPHPKIASDTDDASEVPIETPLTDAEGCVLDVPGHAVAHWSDVSDEAVQRDDLAPSPLSLPDVDDDGQPEQLVYAPYACGVTGNCPRLVYLSGNGCTTYGGGLWADWESETVLDRRHHGVRDLQVFLEGARGDPECGGMKGRIERWRWDGRRYVLARTLRCHCPGHAPNGRMHRACPGWLPPDSR